MDKDLISPIERLIRKQSLIMMSIWIVSCFLFMFWNTSSSTPIPLQGTTQELRLARDQIYYSQHQRDFLNVGILFGGIMVIGFFGFMRRIRFEKRNHLDSLAPNSCQLAPDAN